MFKRIASQLIGCIVLVLLLTNTAFCAIQLFPLALVKFMIPVTRWRALTGKILIRVASNWVFLNSWFIHFFYPTEWNVNGVEKLNKEDWYLIVSNQQSWADIFILQKILYRKIPYIKFFLMKELIWVPVMGLAWWALDFPFIKRFTKEELEKRPLLKGKDMEITKKACEKFKNDYVSVMIFPEGARFTRKKHRDQNSPYKHLLKPKAGGLSFIISAMGNRFHKLLDVTITYPDGPKSLWDFICGNVKKIDVFIDTQVIPEKFQNADPDDLLLRNEFNEWVNAMWIKKDNLMESKLSQAAVLVNREPEQILPNVLPEQVAAAETE